MSIVTQALSNERDGEAFSLVDMLIAEQQETTAVARFAQKHADTTDPLLARQYSDLIPLSKPNPGEQYAFEVDLDACSGCKACVAACHNLNGLDEAEQWRKVGMLHGDSDHQPVLQHVTTACHHCVDPGCLLGCPVKAYDKDPETGIVRHLDDQCIGCQYCVFMCPYDVPRYSPERGIVRKCDMCHDRLAVGEAPACVQSCPNRAISIRTVNKDEVCQESTHNRFLPGTPDATITKPTTRYKSSKDLSASLKPADYYSAKIQHSHMPLVMMLVLTQLSVGAFLIGQLLVTGPWQDTVMLQGVRPVYTIVGFLVGFVGMHAAVFHLGRPQYAFRAFLGLRTSWLSREIFAFGGFAGCAFAYAAALWLAKDRPMLLPLANGLGWLTVAAGIGGVLCSVMIYVKTRRPFWSFPRTAGKFLLTSVMLGAPVALVVSLSACYFNDALEPHAIMRRYGQSLCVLTIIATVAKLALESSVFLYLKQQDHTPMKRTAMLLSGELSMTTLLRYFFGVLGGVVLPLALLSSQASSAGAEGFDPLFLLIVVSLITLLLTLGEMVERFLFFAAVVAPPMPGPTGS